MKASSTKNKIKVFNSKYLYTLLAVFIIFCLWEVLAIIKNDTFVFPHLTTIIKCFFRIFIDKNAVRALFTTVFHVFIVMVVSLLLSSLISFIYLINRKSILLIKPLLNILKAAPFAVISVYIFFAFEKNAAPYIIAFLVVLPICTENLINGISNIDKNITDELAMLNISQLRKFVDVYLPMILPYFVISILTSFSLGLKSMIMAEYICQIEGTIGSVLINTKYSMEFDKILAWLIIIILIVSIIDMIVKFIADRITNKN